MTKRLVLATCQFPVESEPSVNAAAMIRLMRQVRRRGAHLAHFSECCLSGYAGVEIPSMAALDWEQLRAATDRVAEAAAELGLWIVFGSTHRLSGRRKPHNSLYVLGADGRLVTRYDKLFCCGRGGSRPTEDLAHFSPGTEFVDFELRGLRIGLLICHDFRYPELYREYKRRGVDLVLHSYHNARMPRERLVYYHRQVTFTTQAAAASNFVWISANNSASPHAWSSFVVDPAGDVAARLPRHRAGALVTEVATEGPWWDPSYWRDQCLSGVLHSGNAVEDARSRDRLSF